jgi:hypothetical protein
MRGSLRAFLDASVLYPVSLRNLLIRLTLAGLFQARWSAHVHDEWIRAVLRDRPDLPALECWRETDDRRGIAAGVRSTQCVTGYHSDW